MSPATIATLVLIAVGLLGAFLRAYGASEQHTLSRQTVTDILVGGGVVGGLAPLVVTIPGSTLIQQALVIVFASYMGVNLAKDLLTKFGLQVPGFSPPTVPPKP